MIQVKQNARLAGKKAVITGGTTGIGFASAQRYLEEGAEVIITGRSQDGIDRALAELGDGATGFVADSTSLSDLQSLAQFAKEELGQVDILFANAGNGMFAPVDQVDEELYDRQFDLNVKGAFFTVKAILPVLSDGSSVIFTASSVHQKGVPGGSLYFATKAAVRSFARTMAAELGGRGIRVNTLSPGLVPTNFFENSNAPVEMYDDFDALAGKGAPLGRAGKPVEIAELAVFLGSDEASFVTAADYVADGGWMNV
ncbi:SDR family oxidoreductase [Erythrobacter sp. SCSIO 43205]|uniref:SDR family oxidoreductase n=1 Tax=Erythrobacter sp. SCSIO 43205 TaxID=2779361 RepID=UPI001CA8B1AA|nr:SDR family oxidoreductase [Erythrobacter sp. SCSIO 43205]UAB77990.1 SDR family oxidoreductase [Erythrobacter sp. SCSIO 43205]